jgi:hypothetical protein
VVHFFRNVVGVAAVGKEVPLDYWTLILGPKFSPKERKQLNLSRFYAIAQIEYCRNFIFKRHFPISRIPLSFVISRNTAFIYKDKTKRPLRYSHSQRSDAFVACNSRSVGGCCSRNKPEGAVL